MLKPLEIPPLTAEELEALEKIRYRLSRPESFGEWLKGHW
jgi:hypothetical protein